MKSKKPKFTEATYIGTYAYIKPNQITCLPAFDVTRNYFSAAFQRNKENLKKNRHTGDLSPKARKRLRTAVDWLVVSAKEKSVYDKSTGKYFKFSVNFVTLTMPDTDEPVTEHTLKKKLLQPFLAYMRKYGYLRNYVWKLEFHKSGKAHIHITTDTFIHYSDLRNNWNRILRNNNVLSKWERENGNKQPNSTDVHSVYKVANVAAYISKYMSKSGEGDTKATTRLWGCNYELSRAFKTMCHLFPNEEADNLRQLFNPNIEFKPLFRESGALKQVKKFGEVFFLKADQWQLLGRSYIRQVYNEARSMIRNLTPDMPIEKLVIESIPNKITEPVKRFVQGKLDLQLY